MKKVAVMVQHPPRHFEALRSSLGCLLENHEVSYLVLNDEIRPDAAFLENLDFLKDMEGLSYSNHPANAEKYGFTFMTLAQMGELLRLQDIVIPF